MQAQDRGQQTCLQFCGLRADLLFKLALQDMLVIRKLHNLESKIFAMMLAPLTSREFV
jgi:hypothetical protein